jgi:hypothetical protein
MKRKSRWEKLRSLWNGTSQTRRGRARSGETGRRSLRIEALERRALLAADMTSAAGLLSMDVDSDGSIAPLDALQVINELNTSGSATLPSAGNQTPAAAAMRRLDANGDGYLSPGDALVVINELNTNGTRQLSVSDLKLDSTVGLTAPRHTELDKVFHDVNALRASSDLTPGQVVQFVQDLALALKSATTAPSAASVRQLVNDMKAAEADNTLSPEETSLLSSDLQKVLQEANIPEAQVQAVVADVGALASSAQATKFAIFQVVHDLRDLSEQLDDPTGGSGPGDSGTDDGDNNHPPTLPPKIDTLVKDLNAIQTAGSYTPAQLVAIQGDVAAFSPDGTLPDAGPTGKFLDDFVAATADSQLTDAEQQMLVADVVAVLQSANVSPLQARELLHFFD